MKLKRIFVSSDTQFVRFFYKLYKMTDLTETSSIKSFGGFQKVYSHESELLGCKMNFAIYLPPEAEHGGVPVLYWLSGLTCTEQNFIQKAGAQRVASKLGICIVCPDTSPRGLNIPGEDDTYDFGSGASFYLDATQEPWSKNYKMYSYVTQELPEIINKKFPVDSTKRSIFGHSMGGHGALICALKNPGLYQSVSAFAPICNPTKSPWGKRAFSGYLGDQDQEAWKEWDATELVKDYRKRRGVIEGPRLELFIDQGLADEFLTKNELLPENLLAACRSYHMGITLNKRKGYDHSYFYIASYIEEHLNYHATHLL